MNYPSSSTLHYSNHDSSCKTPHIQHTHTGEPCMVSVLQRVCRWRYPTNTRTLEAQETLKIEDRTPLWSVRGAAVEIVLGRSEGGQDLEKEVTIFPPFLPQSSPDAIKSLLHFQQYFSLKLSSRLPSECYQFRPSHVVQSGFRVWFPRYRGRFIWWSRLSVVFFRVENKWNIHGIHSVFFSRRKRLGAWLEKQNKKNEITFPINFQQVKITVFPRGTGTPVTRIEASKKAAATYIDGANTSLLW